MLMQTYQHFNDRWYQQESVQAIFDYFNAGNNGNPLISLPTGSGKSVVIARFIWQVLQMFPRQRFIVATHVKELIKQNADKFSKVWPHAPMGIHSAGLSSRDHMQPIIFGGIQSMVNNVEIFGHRDLLIIDEAHLVSPGEGTRYQDFIGKPDMIVDGKLVEGYGLRKINPYLKVIGLSATVWRQKIGKLTDPHEGRIFTDTIYDICNIEGFNRLIAEGYLAKLIPKRTSIEIDTSNVGMSNNGEFNQKQLQNAANQDRVTIAALTEACQYGFNRRSWLAFASGIEHAEKVAAMLNQFGINSAVVHSKTTKDDRDKRIKAHQSGELRCLVGNNIFTTGYDHPPLDFIIDLQPTMSVAKHVQKYGRGMRPSLDTGKENCLILDFGGNVRRCGPINDPYIPKRAGKGGGDAPCKICDHCGTYNHAAARFCDGCGEPFEFDTKIVRQANEEEILKSDLPIIEVYPVERVFYWKHISKTTGNVSFVCSYWSGLSKYDEWIYPENKKAKHFANEWWRARHAIDPPDTVDEMLQLSSQLRIPRFIHVWINTRHPKVTKVEW